MNALLGREVWLTGWSSPTVAERERSPEIIAKLAKKRLETCGQTTVPLYHCEQAQLVQNGPARLTASGEMLTGSAAQMESGGRLHPAHSLWLQLGPFATAWASCAERVTRSTSRKPRASSKP
jgi:hypothetical protein